MTIAIDIGIIIITSIVIYFSGNSFAAASSNIGDYLRLPRSVKGATFDAIASSLPELMIALFSIIFFKRFEVGVGTIVGSAFFNLLIIPALAVLLSPVVFRIERDSSIRDGFFYLISVFTLLVILTYFKVWGLLIPAVLITIYIWYLYYIAKHTRKHRKIQEHKKKTKEFNISKEILLALLGIIIIGVTAFFLTDSAINLSEALGIPAVIIAFTVIAAATSLPDLIISVFNAKKGDADSAISNVFGSNTFDILIGLGLPAIIGFFLIGPTEIIFNNLEIVFGLLGATLLVFYFIIEDDVLDKKEAWAMLIIYFIFLAYIISLAF